MVRLIADRTGVAPQQVVAALSLFDEGATIPFVARYRKERTGSLDEVALASIREEDEKLRELEKRKETILKSIAEQQLLTPALRSTIEGCYLLNELEDLYLPYKPKRRTRAMIAREKGLEPLAEILMDQRERDPAIRAERFLSDQVSSVEEALAGARDIVAEVVSEHQGARNLVRNSFSKEAVIRSRVVKGKEEEGIKYKDYFDATEWLRKCPSHRMLAMRRGEKEGFLKLDLAPDEEKTLARLNDHFITSRNGCSEQLEVAIRDSYKRLLAPSIETEFMGESKNQADLEAIKVFAENLRQLLLAPPLGQKRVMGIDPGFRSGCKVVCLDAQGNLLHNETIYPHPPQSETIQAMKKIGPLIESYRIEALAIGDGTASRETEMFFKRMRFDRELQIFMVSEDGASVYSASKTARDEFPQYDVTVRGAVSIGRRLMDPLAELVKIDPKSIGVGQYQHDVDQKLLQQALETTVVSCVNKVGVDLNTASSHLLHHISGLNATLAANIVEYRQQNGPYPSREALKKVARMGPKAFEQCAGFLRIPGATNPLDNSAVHPERYPLVEKMAADLGVPLDQLIGNEELTRAIEAKRYVNAEVGLPTLTDILSELAKPGRDPRSGIKHFEFAEGIYSIDQLVPGMVLPCIVTNITRFGAFVDVGIKQDGLVHISEMADRFISDPSEVVKLQQHLKVRVVEVDIPRKRIAFSMKGV
ncbi:MAG: RNA-binding transcriptional accessory protein [Marinilabiliales bacterium]|nr:RNA-binding transcriptional accessory protein [Marinilabiliales bacterium]